MQLLEREKYLRELENSLRSLTEGNGVFVLIFGEAGIGKTSLAEKLAENSVQGTRILWGACDALFTPRPLGPLYDIVDRLNNDIREHLHVQSSRNVIFSTLLKELQEHPTPNLLVIEDVHWADEATLDFIKFFGRRVQKSNTMFIITYRDDEIVPDHPLRSVLGDIPAKNMVRYPLLPLTEKTVGELAAERGINNLFDVTGGNPFLLFELLNNSGQKIPSTVKDSVTTRISRLSSDARTLVELVSVIPGRAERWLVDQTAGKNYGVLEQCIHAGILTANETAISFKHELSRMAVEESLSSLKKQTLHVKVLQTLLQQPVRENFLARIIHHAAGAGDKKALIQYAPLAAGEAAKLGAHHEAVAHYSRVLNYTDDLDKKEYALLLEKYSYECYLTDRSEDSLNARLKALTIWENFSEQKKIGSNLRWLSRLSWFLGKKEDADRYAVEAVTVLEPLNNDDELAMAYSNRSLLYALSGQPQEAIEWGNKAIEMAESLGNFDILAHALNNVGTAEMENTYSTEGERKLLRSLELSLENGFQEHAARAYTNLGCNAIDHRVYTKGKTFFDDGISYCIERDLDSWKFYMQAWLARLYFETGSWNEADELSQKVLRSPKLSAVTKIPAQLIVGWLRLRRGNSEAKPLLREALGLAKGTGELQRIGPVCVSLLEAAWLSGGFGAIDYELESGFRLALNGHDPWILGALSFWKWRSGALTDVPGNMAEPYAKQIRGDWQGAADLWNTFGCPYEEAMALVDGDEPSMLKALEIFRALGAKPAEEKLLKLMREKGIRSIPRGPRVTTISNPSGLTNRQLDVLRLLADGLTNPEIAARLYLSPKTVDHHVSAILSKLNIDSRKEAALIAYSKGILQK